VCQDERAQRAVAPAFMEQPEYRAWTYVE
jgi:hypothetical protein